MVVDQADQEALRRLGRYVRQDRIVAGYDKLKDFAAELEISTKTIGKLENGLEPVSTDTMVAVETLLHWRLGDSQRVLDDPKFRPTMRRPQPGHSMSPFILSDATNSGGMLASQLRTLYHLVGEAEYLQICLRLGRDGEDSSPPTSIGPTN